MRFSNQNIYFTTLTIDNWISIFQDFPQSNHVVLSSLEYLTQEKGVKIYGFVIMRDHIHILWSPGQESINSIIKIFKQYTGSKILDILRGCNTEYLNNFISPRKDRKHKLWKLSIGNLLIQHKEIFKQKLNYIHLNPTKGEYKTCDLPEDYTFSSARGYLLQASNFTFLTLAAFED